MGEDFEVNITNPGRAAEFLKVFGRTRVSVESPVMEYVELPGKGECLIFKLDMKSISEEERKKLAAHISEKWKMPIEIVEAELDRAGLPILAEDCTVAIANPQRWL